MKELKLDIDINTATIEELRAYEEKVRLDIIQIKSQIDSAEEDLDRGKQYDKDWYIRAKGALSYKGAIAYKLVQIIADRVKAERRSRQRESNTIPMLFMHFAKEYIPQEVYDTILLKASQEKYRGVPKIVQEVDGVRADDEHYRESDS